MKKEVWKRLAEPFDQYEISDLGRVKSYKNKSPKILVPNLNSWGYQCVFLHDGSGNRKCLRVHRIVMAAFVGESAKSVNHINGIKADNKLKNLEYVTHAENEIHAYINGLKKRGADHHSAKLNPRSVIKIFKSTTSSRNLARKFGVHKSTIDRIKRQKTWKHLTEGLTE